MHKKALETRQRLLDELTLVSEPRDDLTSLKKVVAKPSNEEKRSRVQELREQLEFEDRLFGENPHTLLRRKDLGNALSDLGDHGAAAVVREEAVEISRRICGPQDPETLAVMSDLAATKSKVGDAEGARKLYEQVLDAASRVIGPDHLRTLDAMNNMAIVLFRQQDRGGARNVFEQVLEMSHTLYGPRESNGTIAAWHLPLLLRSARKDFALAKSVYERDLKWLLTTEPQSDAQRQIKDMVLKLDDPGNCPRIGSIVYFADSEDVDRNLARISQHRIVPSDGSRLV